MNMMDRFGLTPCPYCSAGMLPWTAGKRVHHCERCQRPLAIYRGLFKRDRFRIIPLYAAVHATAALLFVLALVTALIGAGSMRHIMLAVAFPLALFGASDVADGYLSIRTGVSRIFGRVRRGGIALAIGAGTILFGLAGCLIALIGITAFTGAQ